MSRRHTVSRSGLWRYFKTAVDGWKRGTRDRQTIERLESLPPNVLHDIGLRRDQVAMVVRKGSNTIMRKQSCD